MHVRRSLISGIQRLNSTRRLSVYWCNKTSIDSQPMLPGGYFQSVMSVQSGWFTITPFCQRYYFPDILFVTQPSDLKAPNKWWWWWWWGGGGGTESRTGLFPFLHSLLIKGKKCYLSKWALRGLSVDRCTIRPHSPGTVTGKQFHSRVSYVSHLMAKRSDLKCSPQWGN